LHIFFLPHLSSLHGTNKSQTHRTRRRIWGENCRQLDTWLRLFILLELVCTPHQILDWLRRWVVLLLFLPVGLNSWRITYPQSCSKLTNGEHGTCLFWKWFNRQERICCLALILFSYLLKCITGHHKRLELLDDHTVKLR